MDRKIQMFIEAYQRRKLDVALRLGSELVTEDPRMPLGNSLYAQALLEAGQRDKALKVMLEARAAGAATEPLLRQLGLSLSEVGATPRRSKS